MEQPRFGAVGGGEGGRFDTHNTIFKPESVDEGGGTQEVGTRELGTERP